MLSSAYKLFDVSVAPDRCKLMISEKNQLNDLETVDFTVSERLMFMETIKNENWLSLINETVIYTKDVKTCAEKKNKSNETKSKKNGILYSRHEWKSEAWNDWECCSENLIKWKWKTSQLIQFSAQMSIQRIPQKLN